MSTPITPEQENAAQFMAATWLAMQEQEANNNLGLSGEDKKNAVKRILKDAFGSATWSEPIIDAVIDLLVTVDRSDQTLNLRTPCGCLPCFKKK